MPVWLAVLLLSSGLIGTGYLVVRYLLKRANLKPSRKGLLVAGLSVASVTSLYLVLRALGIDAFRGTLFEGALAALFLSFATQMMLVRRRSGPELADLGPFPLRAMFLAVGALQIVLATGGLIVRSFSVGQSMVNLAQGTFFLVLGLIHSQIRSRGIYHGGGLIPWDRIVRYEWSNEGTLLIDLRRPRWWQDRVQLPVPPVLVDRVDELMRLHVAKA